MHHQLLAGAYRSPGNRDCCRRRFDPHSGSRSGGLLEWTAGIPTVPWSGIACEFDAAPDVWVRAPSQSPRDRRTLLVVRVLHRSLHQRLFLHSLARHSVLRN